MTNWEPIAQGSLATEAFAALDDINNALPQPGGVLGAPGSAPDPSLASGDAGLALYWAYQSLSSGTSEHAERSLAHVDQAIHAVAETVLSERLYSGFTGVAWVVEHLRGRVLHGTPDMNTPIDEALASGLQGTRLRPFDLIIGLVGVGLYAVDRTHHPCGRSCLTEVLRHLEISAERPAEGATWFTPPELSSATQRTYAPLGHHNLGVAHGVPGVIGLLGTAIAQGAESPSTHQLLEDAVRWLMSCRLPDARPTVFPTYVVDGALGSDSRSAWCYGDPGVAIAVLIAARATDNADWERAAVGWLHKCAMRPILAAGVQDAGLCHGAAGLAHIFNRAYQATGIGAFKDASLRWLRHVFTIRRNGDSCAGFPAKTYTTDSGGRWEPQAGLLAGAAGVGLALLAAVTDVEPAWDRCMLLDVPLRG